MLEVQGLTKLYDQFTAVSDLSFAVEPGHILGLVGPNGAGKTTTLRCLSGIFPATRGTVRVCGHDIKRDSVAAKHELAFIPDEPRVFDYLTVEQHLNFTARMYQIADWRERGQRLLQDLNLADKAKSLPAELSRGMKQKLVIACGLLHSPKVILLDEPLTGLDPVGIRQMKDYIRQRARDGVAIVLSSHLLDMLDEICTHVLILKDGRKILNGTIDEVRRSVSDDGGTKLEDAFLRAIGAGS